MMNLPALLVKGSPVPLTCSVDAMIVRGRAEDKQKMDRCVEARWTTRRIKLIFLTTTLALSLQTYTAPLHRLGTV